MLPLVFAAALAAGPDAHWPLAADARDRAGTAHGSARGVAFAAGEATFDGKGAHVEVPDGPALRPGRGDFSLSVWLDADAAGDDLPGDVLSKFDPATRRGFQLGVHSAAGGCTSTANTRNLTFALDAGTEPKWADAGRPGESSLPFALAVFRGELYAGTWEPAAGGAGGVYRTAGDGRWLPCGKPDACNAISALAVHDGKLYAGSSRYSGAGSHLPLSPNAAPGGRVWRYEGGSRWEDCGRPSRGSFIGSLAVFGGKLYASALDLRGGGAPEPSPDFGVYRYEGGQAWSFCGHAGGRVVALAVHDGRLYGTGYDGNKRGGVFRYEGGQTWSDLGPPPNVTQTYSLAALGGRLHAGTWPEGKVFRLDRGDAWADAGRLGGELEVMGSAVYNGKLYAGTLPLAEVWRYDGGQAWARTGRLDFTETEFRRAWSMAVYKGRLYCGVLPSGRVHALAAGAVATHDDALPPGWHHVAAVRAGGTLRLYLDGRVVAESAAGAAAGLDVDCDRPLRLGNGEQDSFRGKLAGVRFYRRALADAEVRSLAAR